MRVSLASPHIGATLVTIPLLYRVIISTASFLRETCRLRQVVSCVTRLFPCA